jgi:hypothetical protein
MLTRTASTRREPTNAFIASTWGGSRTPTDGTIPAYGASIPVVIDAPEQASGTNVTELFAFADSSRAAACASNPLAERWQRRSCQRTSVTPWSGLPSPDAVESPSPTTSRSRIVTATWPVPVCPARVAVTLTRYGRSRAVKPAKVNVQVGRPVARFRCCTNAFGLPPIVQRYVPVQSPPFGQRSVTRADHAVGLTWAEVVIESTSPSRFWSSP